MIKIKTIDRDIKLAFDYKGNTYGTNLNNDYFELIVTTQKIKNTIDDYEFVEKWHKLHYISYNKLDIAILFNQLIEEVL